jgi:two-component system chemotaxis response regulator CheB
MAQAIQPQATEAPIEVLVVDDSAVARAMIARFAGADPAIRVVGTATDGESALAFLAQRAVDVVLLDIQMPGMDGLAALPEILRLRPDVRVIVVSSVTPQDAQTTLRALELGACECMEKPQARLGPDSAVEFGRALVLRIKGLAADPSIQHLAPKWTRAPLTARPPEAVAIGSSTGGPPALLRILRELGDIRQPIFLTQHMPANFIAPLSEQLARASGAAVAVARDGEPVLEHRVYVAPGGAHMTVARRDDDRIIKLLPDAPPEHFCKPAVDPMLRSLATAYGAGLLTIILTGMGADGALGCEAVAKAGGRFVVQDRETSVVWGMPAAAARTGLAEAALPLQAIAPWLKNVLRGAS